MTSVAKVASRYLEKVAAQESEGPALYRDFETAYKNVSEYIRIVLDPTITKEDIGKRHPMSYALYVREIRGTDEALKRVMKEIDWKYLVNIGHRLAQYIFEYKSIPKGKVKAMEVAGRLFMSMRRNPRKLESWWKKNAKSIQLMLESKSWPLRNLEAGTEEAWKLGPFEVHNTVGAPREKLDKTEKAIQSAAKFLNTSGIPKAREVLYGPILLVNKLQQPRTLAWYYPRDDKVYLRLHMKVGPGEVHNLVHELGHRYWKKHMPGSARTFWAKHHRSLKDIGESSEPELDEHDQRELDELNSLEVGDVFPIKVQGMIRNGPNRIVKVRRNPEGIATAWDIENKKGKRARITRNSYLMVKRRNSMVNKARAQYPTAYASTDPEEHFCESFAMYAMGKLPVEHQDAFEKAVKGTY
jgi:hypothetical protein